MTFAWDMDSVLYLDNQDFLGEVVIENYVRVQIITTIQ